ncbi:MAG: M57 family metalloprotease [Polyangiales bacterium]
MNTTSPRVLPAALALAALSGCGGDPSLDPPAAQGGAPAITYEQFVARSVERLPGGAYRVERDIVVSTEAAVRAYYDAAMTPPGALIINRVGPAYSLDDKWGADDRWALTYCVSNAFGANRPRVIAALQRAMQAWEAAADVRFVHLTDQDATCSQFNTNVKFDVSRAADDWADGIASMGFPSTARSDRRFMLRWSATDTYTDEFLTAVAMHELGHGLGFRHEHTRSAPAGSDCRESSDWRALTPYDSLSVMHYPFCPGWSDPSWQWNFLTQWDIEGAQSVYGAPTNVLNGQGGALYARRRSTGELFRKTNGLWVKIGDAGQGFVTVGDTLYGQRPGRGEPVRYNSGQSWTIIGGPAGQIFNCGGALCATDPNNGNVARYSGAGSSWTVIGGPGSRFAATSANALFGITPAQHEVARYNGAGASWTVVGGGASELFGGGSSMFRLNTTRDAIERYAGSGSTWTVIGGPGRQFLPTGSALYALSPTAGTVRVYATTQWNPIGGAAARLYGSYGRLYATNPTDESIWRYEPANNTWYAEGKP